MIEQLAEQEDAEEVVARYHELLTRALLVVRAKPYRADVENDEYAVLTVDGDAATVHWLEISSGYYGSWDRDRHTVSFPTRLLIVSEAELLKIQNKARVEDEERQAKVRAAQAAVALDQEEKLDRAEWARLQAKYGK